MERNHFNNFGSGLSKEHFCEIILKSGYWPRIRWYLKVFLFFSLSGNFVQRSGKISVILVEGHIWDIFMKLFSNRAIGIGGDAI